MKLNRLLENKKIKSIARESWSVSWPMILIMFFIFLIGLTDVYIAGRLGKEIKAAYGLAFQLYFIFGIIAAALTVGAVSVISRLFTSGRTDDFNVAVDSSLITAIIAGALFSFFGIAFSKNIIFALGVPEVLKELAVPLLKVYSLGLIFNYVLINTNGILRACKKIRKSLWTMCLVCFLNVILDFVFALHTPLGAQGIAAATAVSIFFGSILNFIHVKGLIRLRFKFSFSIIKKIFTIGWPAGMLQILWHLGTMAIFLILSALPRNNIEIIAAFTSGVRIESVIYLCAFAFNLANAVVVGNLLGKNEKEDAFAGGIVTAAIGVILVSFLTLLVLLNARGIAAFLSRDSIVINESVRYLYICLIIEPIMAWGLIMAGGLSGAGDTKSIMKIIVLNIWLVRIPLAYIMGIYFGFGAAAVWWSMNLSVIIQTVLVSKRYFSKKWIARAEKTIRPQS